MTYGLQSTERAEALAQKRGITLFKAGEHVVTHHGNTGVIAKVQAYGDDNGLWMGMSTYHVIGQAFGPTGMLVDFWDAHYTLGGTLRVAQ